ncbi:CynX/NimT family MFS transporter [Paenibacillus barengoltzii]|uniref:MFS transporter, CP family, cyanate transporter n=1 Tax=Paenibacillus barengoltzii J12 TaxID=935846 RepID=A0ABY1LSJ9_9BACL|nr:MFS transporter [Paenibacillus barengoltzii]SME95107.1 MFS transporter, CP family, cyanate transporter [Paenibacillus barengoltzii J12]
MNKTIAAASNPDLDQTRRTSVWLLVTAVLLTAAALRSPITGVGALIGEIEAATGLSHAMSGMLTTLPLIAFAVFALAAPGLSAKLGIERTLFFSMVLMTGGILVRSLPSVAALFAGTALIGIAIAVCNVLLPGLIKRDFPQQVGLMTSLFTTCLTFWAAISSGISVPLSQGPLGWRGALTIWVVLTAIASLAWLPLLPKRTEAGQNQNNAAVAGRFATPEGEVTNTTARPQSDLSQASGPRLRIWRSRVAWLVTIFMGFQSILFYVSISWLPDILQERGMNAEQAGWMLSLMQLVSMAGSFLMPLFAARSDNQKWLTAASAALCVIGFGGIWAESVSLAPLFILLLGVGSGSTFGLAIVFFSLRSRTTEQASALSGMAQSIGYILAAFGPTLFGYLHDLSGNWDTPLAVITGVSIITALFGYAAGRKGDVDAR